MSQGVSEEGNKQDSVTETLRQKNNNNNNNFVVLVAKGLVCVFIALWLIRV